MGPFRNLIFSSTFSGIGCPETSVRNYQYSLRNDPEETQFLCSPMHNQTVHFPSHLPSTFPQISALDAACRQKRKDERAELANFRTPNLCPRCSLPLKTNGRAGSSCKLQTRKTLFLPVTMNVLSLSVHLHLFLQ
jgi:hypothetical protein